MLGFKNTIKKLENNLKAEKSKPYGEGKEERAEFLLWNYRRENKIRKEKEILGCAHWRAQDEKYTFTENCYREGDGAGEFEGSWSEAGQDIDYHQVNAIVPEEWETGGIFFKREGKFFHESLITYSDLIGNEVFGLSR